MGKDFKVGKVTFKTIGSGKRGISIKGNEYIRLSLNPDDLKDMKEADLSEKIFIFKRKTVINGEPEYFVSAPVVSSTVNKVDLTK